MAKKKKQIPAKAPLLSPENYIRQKSRNLPIYKCWINKDWKECRLAQIFIARKHANDNVTFCIYLVDLGCLGVKDTSYSFNKSLEEVEEMIMRIEEDVEMDDTLSYSLAHNIIYSAIEFAEEYGFKPHRDFTQITQFFLEEDTDEIPLIAVECGHLEDGKPFFINTGYASPAKEKQVIAQLNKTAGEGNYHFFMGIDKPDDEGEYDDEYDEDEDEYDEEEDYDEFDDTFDELCQLSTEEKKTLFFELYHSDDDALTQKGVQQLVLLTPLLAKDYTDGEAVDKYSEELFLDLDYPTVEMDEFPNSFLSGVTDKDLETVYDYYFDSIDAIAVGAKERKKAIKMFRDEIGDAPIVAYAELKYLDEYNQKKYVQKLEEYHTKYPDYFLIQLDWNMHLYLTQTNVFQKNITAKKIKTLLSESKQRVTFYEVELFVVCYYRVFIDVADIYSNPTDVLARNAAFEKYLSSFENESENFFNQLKPLLFIREMSALKCILDMQNK
ncbi:hypothetical protein AGMMS49525_02920 [Bacteroidia bacterium]|nr:hypothetical protein AGMMS49525_02920 [Bacteroidia bacterium]